MADLLEPKRSKPPLRARDELADTRARLEEWNAHIAEIEMAQRGSPRDGPELDPAALDELRAKRDEALQRLDRMWNLSDGARRAEEEFEEAWADLLETWHRVARGTVNGGAV